MGELLIQILFGWPAIITTILLSLAGVSLKKPVLLAIAGLVCIPFTYYLSGYLNLFMVLPSFSFGSAYAVIHQKSLLARLLIAPIVMIAIVLAYVVLTQ